MVALDSLGLLPFQTQLLTRLFFAALLISWVYAAPAFPHAAADDSKTSTGGRTTLAKRDVSPAPQINWGQVDQAIGKAGVDMPGGVHRYSFPRTDLTVVLDGVHLNAGFALGGFAAFKPWGNASIAMGDLVLTEDEINPIISALQQGGIQQTALHNHLLFETPHVMYLHFKGQGDPVQLASTLHAALNLTKTPLTAPPNTTTPLGLDTAQLDAILGYQGKATNGVYQYSIPRTETITDGDEVIPPAMGVATAINFQATGDGTAAITGDFTLIAEEVPPVLQTLRKQSINITALHSHMLTDSPHLLYIHFWANEDALDLAHGLRAALNQTNSTKASTGSGGAAASPSPSSRAALSQGGVFATISVSGAASPPKAPVTISSTMSMTPSTTPVATSAATPAASSAPASTVSGAQTPGSACSTEGEWNCIGGTLFQRCASGTWSAVQQMAAGTICTSGTSAALDMKVDG